MTGVLISDRPNAHGVVGIVVNVPFMEDEDEGKDPERDLRRTDEDG